MAADKTAVGAGAPSTPGELTPKAIVPVTSRQSSAPAGGVITLTDWVVESSSHRPLEAGAASQQGEGGRES